MTTIALGVNDAISLDRNIDMHHAVLTEGLQHRLTYAPLLKGFLTSPNSYQLNHVYPNDCIVTCHVGSAPRFDTQQEFCSSEQIFPMSRYSCQALIAWLSEDNQDYYGSIDFSGTIKYVQVGTAAFPYAVRVEGGSLVDYNGTFANFNLRLSDESICQSFIGELESSVFSFSHGFYNDGSFVYKVLSINLAADATFHHVQPSNEQNFSYDIAIQKIIRMLSEAKRPPRVRVYSVDTWVNNIKVMQLPYALEFEV